MRTKREIEHSKKTGNKCFACRLTSHYRVNCPKLKKNEKDIARVNHIRKQPVFKESFFLYLSRILVNGKKTTALWDSGTRANIVSNDFLNQNQLNGDYVWIKTQLECKLYCLSMAEVTLEIKDLGTIKTTTGVASLETDIQYYPKPKSY